LALHDIAQQTVTGLGYDLVDLERSAGGLLRITIDWPWNPQATEHPMVTVEDCERVTRQLQFALEVAAVEYRRLEVSSPGIDRPLRTQADFERFAGEVIDITLKAPMGSAAGGLVHASRRKFRGTLERAEPAETKGLTANPSGWQIVWKDEPPSVPGKRPSRKKEAVATQVLGFRLDELKEARLAPIVDFKGRERKPTPDDMADKV
jgi:ribosome maturation factor RimP